MALRNLQTPKTQAANSAQKAALPTFLDHIHELRRRLFWVVGAVILASAAAFPLQKQIMAIITAPLGGKELYYITPVGGFSFLIKVCTYVGIIVAIPLIVYHLYKFLEPLMQHIKASVLAYVGMSSLLAACGMAFAYFVSLPAALHFLVNIDIGDVHAMLTVDSYLNFVMAYLLGAAALFQIPLVINIINKVTPLPPKKLMGAQRYVVLAAFIIAAIISPTPDVINQVLLAAPIIVMYQVGILAVWITQSRMAPKKRFTQPASAPMQSVNQWPVAAEVQKKNVAQKPGALPVPSSMPAVRHAASAKTRPAVLRPVVTMDGFTARPTTRLQPVRPTLQRPSAPLPAQPVRNALQPRNSLQNRPLSVPQRSMDGMVGGATFTQTA